MTHPAHALWNDSLSGIVYIADSRHMFEVASESIGLVVTSPPYWQIKDYEVEGQIGYNQSLHEYLYDLARVWQECWRVLKPGRRLCINIGDQFACGTAYGHYSIIPLHAEIISQCTHLGFAYMGSIIWQKKATLRPSGGAVIMGSYPYPPSGIVEIDYEYILIFKKPGRIEQPSPTQKQRSKLDKVEWKSYFQAHWNIGGTKQREHKAMFPEEIPKRLIKMFSFVGDTILDPFLGSGTTLKAAIQLERNGIGYEIQEQYVDVIKHKLGIQSSTLWGSKVQIIKRSQAVEPVTIQTAYKPFMSDIDMKQQASKTYYVHKPTHKVVQVLDEVSLLLNDGTVAILAGISVYPDKASQAITYLNTYLRGKKIIVYFLSERTTRGQYQAVYAYISLRGRFFINRKMVTMGLAYADPSVPGDINTFSFGKKEYFQTP